MLKGHPSRIQPFRRQSGLLNLSLTKSMTTSSGTTNESVMVNILLQHLPIRSWAM